MGRATKFFVTAASPGAFTSPFANTMDAFGQGWQAELEDVLDVLQIPNTYFTNTDTKVQLQAFAAACQGAIDTVNQIFALEVWPAAPSRLFDRGKLTSAAAATVRMGERWVGAAHGMVYTVMHMPQRGGGPNVASPGYTVTLTGPDVLKKTADQAFANYVNAWYQTWFNFYGWNLATGPLNGGAENTAPPYRPVAGPLWNLNLGYSALFNDTDDVNAIASQYLTNPQSNALMGRFRDYWNTLSSTWNAAVYDEFAPSTLPPENYDPNDQPGINQQAAARIAWRWHLQGAEDLALASGTFNGTIARQTTDTIGPVPSGIWGTPALQTYGFDRFLWVPIAPAQYPPSPFDGAPPVPLLERWMQHFGIPSNTPGLPSNPL